MLPPPLRDAVEAEVARVDARRVTHAARALIEAYRATPDHPARPPGLAADAWRAAYLEVRLPATFAAVRYVARELARVVDLSACTSLLDLGAGPGTALHALAPWLPRLAHATLVDRDDDFLDVADRLAGVLDASAGGTSGTVRVVTEQRDLADVHRPGPHDMVVLAYALGEVVARERLRAVERAWLNATRALVLIEPGTMAGTQRLLDVRQYLVSRGAHVAAPCPHARACPMAAPDWCHVAVRVDRTRRMRQIKRGDLGYEDEAVAYLILTRGHGSGDAPAPDRVVGAPRAVKGAIQLPLCTSGGLTTLTLTRRDAGWRAARRVRWGDRWGDAAEEELATPADDP